MSALDLEILAGLNLLDIQEKQSLLGVIRSFLNLKQDIAQRISKEQYNLEQDEAVARLKTGEYYSQEDAEAQAPQW